MEYRWRYFLNLLVKVFFFYMNFSISAKVLYSNSSTSIQIITKILKERV